MSVQPVFLHVELKIVPRELQRFLTTMTQVAPLIQASGWTFVGAWQVRVGRAHTIRVIWSLPSADAFFAERKALTSHPQLKQFREILDAAIEEETVTMMTAVPYGISR